MADDPKSGGPPSAKPPAGGQGPAKNELKNSLSSKMLAASTETVTKAKVVVPNKPKEPATTVQARAVQPPQSHVPTSVKRDPAKAAPQPIVKRKSGTPLSGKKKPAPPNAKKVGWDPRRVRDFLSGAITLGDLEGISKKEQYEMAKAGHRLLRQGKVDKADQIFQGLIALDPHDAYFHLAVGSCAQRVGDAKAAEAAYTLSLAINPASVHALANRGEVRLMLGQVVEGAKDLMAAVDLDPGLKLEPTLRAQATIRVLQAQLVAAGITVAAPKPKAAPPPSAVKAPTKPPSGIVKPAVPTRTPIGRPVGKPMLGAAPSPRKPPIKR